jgi:putative DNA-invertase from lambdoid prophage Rac
VAEFEKDIIRERVRAGLENARQKGKRLGRAEINNDILQKARVLQKQGLSFRRIERQSGVGEGTIRKRIKTLA